MTRFLLAFAAAAALAACPKNETPQVHTPDLSCNGPAPYGQWGQDQSHSSTTCNRGQPLTKILADVVYDPFVAQEEAEARGDLLAHYQSPLVSGDEVVMSAKWGTYVSCNPPHSGGLNCGPNAWSSQTWGVQKYQWQGATLAKTWNFESDYKPVPNGAGLQGWEPVFHAAMTADSVWVPGAGGSVYQLSRATGAVTKQYKPLGDPIDPRTFVAGPLTVDALGRVLYNAVRLDATSPWSKDILGAWLVRVDPAANKLEAVTFASLTAGAPQALDPCVGTFATPGPGEPALPPVDTNGQPTRPASSACGSQRPGINVAPAVGLDGTIFTAGRAHFNSHYGYVVAVNNDLTPKWSASLRDRLSDGCGVLLATDGTPGNCASYARRGVDPQTNEAPAGLVIDSGTSSPVALPDGAVLFGANTRYNDFRGHLFKFAADGKFLASYDFGWDITPAWFPHDGTYSIVTKDNHYTGGPYQITQLDAGLKPEWKFTATNTQSCVRAPDGSVSCQAFAENANGFEWCVNAPIVDRDGTVYANSEDGYLYAIAQGGALKGKIFLQTALGAAYTPMSIDGAGRVFTQNSGHLFVVGQ